MISTILLLIFVFCAVCLGVAAGVLIINKLGKAILQRAIKARLNQQKSVESKYMNQITGLLWEDLTSANIAGMFPVSLTDYFPLTGTKLDRIRKKNPDAFVAICARLAPLALALKRAVEIKGGVSPEIQAQMSSMPSQVLGGITGQDPKSPLP